MRRALVMLLMSWAWVGAAHADVIGADWEPPRCPDLMCPQGSAPAPSGSHSGCSPGCSPGIECATDADCASLGEGARCVETRFCLGEGFAGRLGPQTMVQGQCGADGACFHGECRPARRCAAPPPAPPPPAPAPPEPGDEVVVEGPEEEAPQRAPEEPRESDGGCAVNASRAGTSSGAAVGLWLALAWLARRRRSGTCAPPRPSAALPPTPSREREGGPP